MQQNDRAEVVLRHRVALFSQCQDADGFGDRKIRPEEQNEHAPFPRLSRSSLPPLHCTPSHRSLIV